MNYRIKQYGEGLSRILPLKSRILLIGASPDNDLQLSGRGIPDVVLKLEYRTESWYVETMHSGSKVLLNGKKLRAASLAPGDRLEMYGSVLVLDEDTPDDSQSGLDGKMMRERSTDSHSDRGADAILESLIRFSHHVGREKNLKALMQKIGDSLCELLGATDAFIFSLDMEGKPEVFVSSPNPAPAEKTQDYFSDTIIQKVLREGKPLFIANALNDPEYRSVHSVADLRLQSVLCCPMEIGGKTIGIIYLGSRQALPAFGEEDLPALRIYALMAGSLIHHVDLLSRQDELIQSLSEASEEGLVGHSEAMRLVLSTAASVAQTDIGILLEGETGTGKDELAQFIHRKSRRSQKPFVVINCGSLRGELLASELFGHCRGAFTGAIRDHEGLFEAASGGTLFLDEIGEMDLSLQAGFLRVLETGKVRALGSNVERNANVRILCATNRDLAAMVAEGAFRQDLYFRINTFSIQVPPLRERGEDIELLGYHFLQKFRSQYQEREIRDFHPDTLKAMGLYPWPGNVRELMNAVRKGILLASSPLIRLDFLLLDDKAVSLNSATESFQREFIRKALAVCRGSKEKTSTLLGVSRSTLFRYLEQLGIK